MPNKNAKTTFKQGVAKAAAKQSTGRLLTSMGMGAAYLVTDCISARKGRDVRYVGFARPMTPRRHVTNGLKNTMRIMGLGSLAMQLKARLDNVPAAQYSMAGTKTSDLFSQVAAVAFTAPLTIRTMVQSKTLFKGYPYSTFSQVMNMVGLAVVLYDTAVTVKELYERRDTWVPEAQQLFEDLKAEAQTLLEDLKEYALQLNKADESDLDQEFVRLLNDLLKSSSHKTPGFKPSGMFNNS